LEKKTPVLKSEPKLEPAAKHDDSKKAAAHAQTNTAEQVIPLDESDMMDF